MRDSEYQAVPSGPKQAAASGEKRFRGVVIASASTVLLTNFAILASGAIRTNTGSLIAIVVATLISASLVLVFRGKLLPARIITPLSIFLGMTYFLVFSGSGVHHPIIIASPAIVVLAGLLLGQSGAAVFGILTTIVIAGVGYAELEGFFVVPYSSFFEALNVDVAVFWGLNLTSGLIIFFLVRQLTATTDDALRNERIQIEANRELTALKNTLEQRVADATQSLERHAAYLEGSADTSRAVTSILDADELVWRVVELIRERFNLYYVGLFITDERDEWAVLQAGTGAAGRNMVARGHRIRIGEGMIGWSIANSEARIALDVGEDAVRFENPDLPETRCEGALLLRSRGRVLGALTVQSAEEAAFTQDSITTLQTMADQVAIALDNAQLFAQSEAVLEAERRVYGQLSRKAWVSLSQRQSIPRYLSDAPGTVRPITEQQPRETLQAIRDGKIVQDDGLTAIVPIISRGQVLGGVKLCRPQGSGAWTQPQVELVETLADQLSLALERARLYQDTQRRAAREQLAGEITGRIREAVEIEAVLERALAELGHALDAERGAAYLALDAQREDGV